MRSRLYRLAPVVMIGALAVSGCGGDSGDEKPTGAKEAWLEGNKADAELDQVVYRLTRQCMEGKGFTIHPDQGMEGDPTQWVFNPEDVIKESPVGDRPTAEDAATKGYGLDPRGSGPNGSDGESSEEPGDFPSDSASGEPGPEEEYDDRFYTELTDEERDAYFIALEGVNKEKIYEEYWKEKQEKGELEGGKDTFVEPDFPNHEKITLPDGTTRQFPTLGCTADVNKQVFPDGMGVYTEKEFYALDKFSTLIWTDLREGPDMSALNESWSLCMSGRGYDGLESPEDAYNKAYEYYYGPMETSEDGSGVATTLPAEDDYTEPTDEEMDKAREKEIKLAVADLECDQETGLTTSTADLMKGALDTYLVDYETELFDWYEYTKKALGTAQGLLKE